MGLEPGCGAWWTCTGPQGSSQAKPSAYTAFARRDMTISGRLGVGGHAREHASVHTQSPDL